VTFRYKEQFDGDAIPQFGLIAEEVEKISPDLVARDENGKVFTVRYEAVNAMLLNEFLKEHRQVQEQQGQIAELQAALAEQKRQMEALAASVQKVAHRVGRTHAQPQVVRTSPKQANQRLTKWAPR
jgi:predicted RNase H-like nuclease (RuvC/YqgF family)